MQNDTIILGGYETVYMKKLALYLGSRLGERITVEIAEHPGDSDDKETVWLGSEEFIGEVRERMGDAHCITLAEEESAGEGSICRYQSCERLYQQIIAEYRRFHTVPAKPVGGRQKWIVITTGGSTADLTAFSLTCAMILADRARTLFFNFSECSGMEELFLTERGLDLSDLAEALRRDGDACAEAYVRRMEGLDYIMPPSNPMILSELKEEDIVRLTEAVSRGSGYQYIVVAMGNACCGCDRIFKMASKIFLLSEKGYVKECGSREWNRFITLCTGPDGPVPERISVPKIEADSSGMHLLHSWQEGVLGQLARIYLEEL